LHRYVEAEKKSLWGGLDVKDMVSKLREMDKGKQVDMAYKEGGLGLMTDMFNVIEDEDEDEDSDVDEAVRMRRSVRAKAKGKTTAWGAIKKYAKAPVVHGGGLYNLNALDPQLDTARFQPSKLKREKTRFSKSLLSFILNLYRYSAATGRC
jgi:hypothetical protein